MVLVIIAHSFLVCNPERFSEVFLSGLWLITQSASLTFMFVSGMIMSYLMKSGDDSDSSQLRFLKRGLFLLLIVHPVLRVVTFSFSHSNQNFVENMLYDHPITDTIGCCLIIAPFIVRTVKRPLRFAIIILMLFVTLGSRLWWHPDSALAMIIKVVLFGEDPKSETVLAIGWPLVPWLAIFLCGSFVGELYSAMRKNQIPPLEASRWLRRNAFRLMSLGLVLSLLYYLFKNLNPFAWSPEVFVALYPKRTDMLLPFYLGLIMAMAAFLVSYVDYRRKYNRILWGLSVFGRNSLFTFVTQFLVVWTIPALLELKGTLGYAGFTSLVTVGLLVSWAAAYYYGRLRKRITTHDYRDLLQRQCTT